MIELDCVLDEHRYARPGLAVDVETVVGREVALAIRSIQPGVRHP